MTRKVKRNVSEGGLWDVDSVFTHGSVLPHHFYLTEWQMGGFVCLIYIVYGHQTHFIRSFSVYWIENAVWLHYPESFAGQIHIHCSCAALLLHLIWNLLHVRLWRILMQFIRKFPHVVLFLFIFVSQVVLLGMDILSALVSRLQERFRTQVGTGGLSHFNFFYCLNKTWKNRRILTDIYF